MSRGNIIRDDPLRIPGTGIDDPWIKCGNYEVAGVIQDGLARILWGDTVGDVNRIIVPPNDYERVVNLLQNMLLLGIEPPEEWKP